MKEELQVTRNDAEQKFEAMINGQSAFVAYTLAPGENVITFTHTEVPTELEGQGIGGKLARAALDYARNQQLHVRPLCSFMATYIRRHAEYQDLVSHTE